MAASSFDEQNTKFLAWLKDRGATISDSICIADFRAGGRGRGVAATKTIDEGAVLFTIPRTAVLMLTTASLGVESLMNLVGLDGTNNIDAWLGLNLAMIYEHSLGIQSTWKPYLDILPSSFDTPIFWTAEDLSELQASSLALKIGKAEADEQFTQNLLPIVKQLPTAAQLGTTEEVLALCHQFASTIMAYAFDIEPPSSSQQADEEGYVSDEELESLPKGLVPLADLLNADGDCNNARLFYEDDTLVMKAIKPITAGHEIFNDYGELPRSDLLRRYGYITNNYKQWDVVEIPLHDIIIPICQERCGFANDELGDRLNYLEEHDLMEQSYDISYDTTSEPSALETLPSQIPDELLVVIQTLLLSSTDYKDYKKRNKVPKAPRATEGVGETARRVADLLLAVVQKRVSQYPTTLAQDRRFRNEPIFTSNKRRTMALEVRIGEKEILAEAQANLEALLAELGDAQAQEGVNGPVNGSERASKRLKHE